MNIGGSKNATHYAILILNAFKIRHNTETFTAGVNLAEIIFRAVGTLCSCYRSRRFDCSYGSRLQFAFRSTALALSDVAKLRTVGLT